MALPGRLVFTPLGERWPRSGVTAAIFIMQAVAATALLVSRGTVGVWAFVILFGTGFGAITPARAGLIADLFGAAEYGRIAGVLALILSLARTVAPVGASWLYVAGGASTHGYDSVLIVLAALGIASAIAVRVADRGGVPVRLATAEARG
jgi:MFS family permease